METQDRTPSKESFSSCDIHATQIAQANYEFGKDRKDFALDKSPNFSFTFFSHKGKA